MVLPVENTYWGVTMVRRGWSADTCVCETVVGPTLIVTAWPADPANVTVPFWPGTVIARLAAGPPTIAEAVGFGGTSYRVSVTLPV